MTNVRNQGIAHLSNQAGGVPFCKSQRAHIVCAVADAPKWGRICKRCATKAAANKARNQRTADALNASLGDTAFGKAFKFIGG